LNETVLSKADLTGAFARMAQMSGCDLTSAILDGADLSNAELTGARLNGALLPGANLSGANLAASWLTGCDLRNANLTGTNLTGCNLTGARLHGVVFEGIIMDDAWAEWVDLSPEGNGQQRGLLEQVFLGVMSKPLAEILVAGRVPIEVALEVVSHIAEFIRLHPERSDIGLRAFHQGCLSSVFYIEAQSEMSLAAYLAEFADIAGKGAVELFEKLASVLAAENRDAPLTSHKSDSETSTSEDPDTVFAEEGYPDAGGSTGAAVVSPLMDPDDAAAEPIPIEIPAVFEASSRERRLQDTPFWTSEKAFAILTATRDIWLEACSSDTLTVRPPRGSLAGLDVVRGRFAAVHTLQQPATEPDHVTSDSPSSLVR
jgi:hypothetical protein